MNMYRFQRISPRKLNLELYKVYADGGPYCVGWHPIRVREIPRAHKELGKRGYYEMADSELLIRSNKGGTE